MSSLKPQVSNKDSNKHITNASAMDKMADRFYEKMSPLKKIAVSLKSIFNGKSISQVIIKKEIKKISSFIATKKDSHFNVDNMTFNSAFANYIVDIYQAVLPFSDILTKLWDDKFFLVEVLSRILFTDSEGNYNRRSIYDYCSLENLIACYSESGNKEDLVRLISKFIRQNTLTIPDYRYKEVESMLRAYQAMYSLSKIDFSSYLKLFGINITEGEDGKMELTRPSSKSVGIKESYKYFAKMYLSISSILNETNSRLKQIDAANPDNTSANTADFDTLTSKYVFDAYSSYIGNGFDDTLVLTTELTDNMHSLYHSMNSFLYSVPALSILRVAQGNPVYDFVEPISSVDIKGFYMEANNEIIMQEFDVVFSQIKETYFSEQTKKLFKTQKISNLQNYNHIVTDMFDVINIFTYVRSMGIASTFLAWWIPNQLTPLVQVIIAQIFTRHSALQAKISDFVTHTDTTVERIAKLDASLGPDTDAGKILMDIQKIGSINAIESKQALNIIKNNVDNSAKEIINGIVLTLGELEKFLRQKILHSNIETIAAAIVAVYPNLDKDRLMSEVIAATANDIEIFIKLMKRLSEFEQEKSYLI